MLPTKPVPRALRALALALPVAALSILVLFHGSGPPDRGSSVVSSTGTSAASPERIDPSLATAWHHVAAKRHADAVAEASAGPGLPADFLETRVSGERMTFPLPDGSAFEGDVEVSESDADGLLFVQGRVTKPHPGFYFIQRQTALGVEGPLVGNIRFDGKTEAWKLEPTADRKQSRFVQRHIDQVVCVNYNRPPADVAAIEGDPEYAPQTHPYPIPIPSNIQIVPLQSLPGATAVVYLDFDGEKGPFNAWGNFDALPANATNAQIFDVWKMVCEDFQGFTINITTDRRVFDSALPGRRQHVIITPTTDAAPGAGGVAYLNSFNWTESRPCWAFYSTGKSAAEVISHEIGHTLGLSHDGRTSPAEDYYGGHGSGDTGWAPIMGVGYYQKLTQWSKGEYLNANRTQDDLSIITNNNNDVDYRADDHGDSIASSGYLEIQSNNSVSNEGIIEQTGDVDSFRFTTTGGSATLTASTVTLNPNLDILAEIVDATTSTVVASDNPDAGINATVTANLAAGEYLLRIRGTGKGDPLGTGYTNYGCIGSYLITGSVTGGIKPDRFSVAENSPVGASVGTVVPRQNHGSNPLTWAIASGNTSGAFAIDPATGAIVVANPSVLNYEALSLRWDDPATIQLFVTVTDSANPALNETIRTVVTVTDANEPPSAPAIALTMLERTAVGTVIATVAGTDVDRFDFPTYAITAGNAGGVFAINPATGRISVASNLEVAGTAVYNLTITLTDQRSPALSTTTAVTVTVNNIAEGYTPGSIVRTYFEGITGTTVASLTGSAKFPNNPDSEELLTAFDGLAHGDNFGSTIRGYLIPPASGTYRFWIASDNASQLRFSTTSNPANAASIATVSSSTGQYAWTANTSQQSATFNLTAGQAYYIEARHKEGTSTDHVAVAWTGPGITTRQVIPGIYLAPFYQNYAPKVTAGTYSIRRNSVSGQTVATIPVTDVNSTDTFSSFTITSGNSSGIFGIDSATGRLFVANGAALSASAASSHTLTIQTTDSGSPALSGSGNITVNVLPADAINLTGLHREIWTGISGSSLTSLTGNTNYPNRPNTRVTITSFDSGASYGDSYGSRIRARFIPPASGDYQFYIAGDDDCRLLFSANPSGAGATQIASITGWTNANQWTKYTSQTSAVRTLVAGQAVYLEALHKEGGGGDHVSVGYTGPGVTTTTVIPGSMLEPFDINAAPVFSPASYSYSLNAATAVSGQTVGTVSATEPNGEALAFAITSGNAAGAFAIHSSTGTITVANPAALTGGVNSLQVTAQDGGLGSVYPLKSATASVNINVTVPNQPPAFSSDPFEAAALAGAPFTGSLSASDPNPSDTLVYSKVSGPSWLSVASNGALTGTPAAGNAGINAFVVRVTDNGGLQDEAALSVRVLATPVWQNTAGGSWPTSANWSAGFVAGGVGATANFATLDLTADTTVQLDGNRTVGHLVFGDTSPNHAWNLAPGASGQLTMNVTSGNPTITVQNQSATISAALAGTLGFTKLGAGMLVLNHPLNPNSGTVNVAQGTMLLNGSLNSGMLTVSPGATLAGTGSVNGSITSAGTIAPGVDGVATITAGASLVMEPDAGIVWEISDWSGAPGSGHDLIAANGVTINSTPSDPVVIRIVERDLVQFNGLSRTFTLIANTGSLSGFDPARFSIDAGSFSSGNGSWAITASGNQLSLAYTRVNTAPAFAVNTLALSATEDTAFSATVSATDSDPSETLAYTKLSGPAWLQVAANGALTGTPENSDVGLNHFTVRVQDSFGATDSLALEITVANTNDAPVFAANPINESATEDSAFIGQLAASDIDAGDTLTFAKVDGPAWLEISGSGALTGTPANSDVGANPFTVSVSDGTVTVNALLVVTVANTNDAPVFTANPINESATEDSAFIGQLAASDIDAGDTLTFAKVDGPAWLEISGSGALTGTPANGDVGANPFTVSVSDGTVTVNASLVVTVANTNDAPVFASATIAGAAATIGEAYASTLAGTASDPDAGDSLAYAKVSGPAWLIVATDGSLSGIPAVSDAGSNSFTVRVTDAAGMFADVTLEITVSQALADANGNGILDTWETDRFGNADPGAHPPGDDPDGDGLGNLLEYALNTHPLQANASPLLHELETVGVEKHLRLTVPKNPVATNLVFIIEVAGSLSGPWVSDTTTDTEVLVNTPGQLVVRDRTPVSSAERRFIRLKVDTVAP